MRQIIIGLLVFSLLISSASALDVYGYVQDTSGGFLSGVLVELFNSTGSSVVNGTTNTGGFYNLTAGITTTGIYTLNYSKAGYISYSQGAVLLIAGQNKEVNTTLGPPIVGSFNGLIFDVNTLAGISGATVLLQGPGTYVVTTNGSGYYSTNVAPGTYTINASASGYYDNSAANSVVNGSTTTQNIGLTPIGDTTPPVITNVTVSSITQSSAVINWNTNENANTIISYGTSTSLGSGTSNSMLTQSHSITISGLSAGTFYYFNVSSADSAGNLAVSGLYNFTTQPTPPSPPSNTGGGSSSSSGGSGGGGGGGGFISSGSSSSAKLVDFCQSNPYTQKLDSKDSVRFSYAGVNYYLGFGRVDSENVTVVIVPNGMFNLKKGGSTAVDLDNDGVTDLDVTISDIKRNVVPQTAGYNLIKYTIDLSLAHTGNLQCPKQSQSQQVPQSSNTQPVQAIAAGIKNGVLNIIGTITPAQKASPLVGSAITGAIVVAGLALFFIFRRSSPQ